MSINAYQRAEALRNDLEKYTGSVTHTLTFMGRTFTFPIPNSPILSKIATQALDILKMCNVDNVSNLTDIRNKITALKELIHKEKESLVNDTTSSYQRFLENMSTINQLMNSQKISEAFTNFNRTLPRSNRILPSFESMELETEVNNIKKERSNNLELLTKKHVDTIESCKNKSLKDLQKALNDAYSDVKKSSSTPEEKRAVLKTLFEKYAEHVHALSGNAYTNPEVLFGALQSERENFNQSNGALKFNPPLDSDDSKVWQAAMKDPFLKAYKQLPASSSFRTFKYDFLLSQRENPTEGSL